MATSHVPSRALLRRHCAAMKIIHTIPPEERLKLLTFVVLGSELIDEAVEAAEEAGIPLPNSRQRRIAA